MKYEESSVTACDQYGPRRAASSSLRTSYDDDGRRRHATTCERPACGPGASRSSDPQRYKRSDTRVAVIGLGHVGLPMALLLCNAGFSVLGVDINAEKVERIGRGQMPAFEEELLRIADDPSVSSNLRTATRPSSADIFVVAVGTPIESQTKAPDLSLLWDALDSLTPHLHAGNLLIVESTVPPGTCRRQIMPRISSQRSDLKFGDSLFLAHCPERVWPSNTIDEMVNNPRVIGATCSKSGRLAKQFYAQFVKGELRETDDLTAELCKLVENSFRDVNIAFANEIASVAEELGVDSDELIELANMHPRVNILRPGIGVGGHCIPVDPWFIVDACSQPCWMIEAARKVNDSKPQQVAEKVASQLRQVGGNRIAVAGLAYKPNVADMRGSPALRIVELLREMGYEVTAKEPLVPGDGYTSLEDLARGADCLLVLVPHDCVVQELNSGRADILRAMRHAMILEF